MKTIKLETLELTSFNKNDVNHLKLLKELIKDENIIKRFQGIFPSLLHTKKDIYGNGYLVLNNHELIGYVYIGNINKEDNCLYLRIAITDAKRGQGLGKRLLTEITEYIFKTTEIESIRLKIAPDNKASINTSHSSGYSWLINDFYIKHNPYLKIKKYQINN